MAGVLDLVSSVVLYIPSSRNIPLMLKDLSVAARTLHLFLQRTIATSDMLRTAAYSAGTPSEDDSYYENVRRSTIQWNNLMAGYGGSV
jgi:hypothetical protein|uniref:Uncharacterized protein n=1 Tax=Picea sitchensis TaxID=3332 RepID=A9NKU0_PICSI|nr:unknown [Picea sitchensis]